jgi:prepilin-type N-terminal cleavage/methylation domain-containing protein
MTRHARGFSLVELMVAMTVTLIVSGAIYGLLTSGSNAFRREPEVADRQQNIRAAMDLITRDVFSAGAALPTFAQVFTRADPDGACQTALNGCGAPGAMGAAAAAGRGGDDEETDVLEIVSVDEQCPMMSVCSTTTLGGSAGAFVTREDRPACLRLPGLVLLTDNTNFTLQAAAPLSSGAAQTCAGGASPPNTNLTLTAGLLPWTSGLPAPSTSAPPAVPVVFLYRARVVRYMIAPSTDPTDAAPALWRSESGRYDANGLIVDDPGEPGFTLTAGSPWELVARGIEDLQVEYQNQPAPAPAASPAPPPSTVSTWTNEPPVSVVNDWTTLVRQVRITLSARVTAANLQGEMAGAGGAPNAVRGQLSTVVVPRAAFTELQMCLGAGTPCAAGSHIQ